jgi:thiol-disulfide isomerase/thioredoxin
VARHLQIYRRAMRYVPIALLLVAVAACGKPQQPAENEPVSAEAPAVPVKGVDRAHKGKPAPAATFSDPDGGEISLADFRGTPVLVNLWATWCAPCVKELPTLDKLAQSHRVDGQLGVVAVSQDMGPQASVEAYLAKLKISDLGAYHDPKMALSGALGAEVLPTSILYDAQGREVWRYVGDLDWTGEEAARLLSEAGAAAAAAKG